MGNDQTHINTSMAGLTRLYVCNEKEVVMHLDSEGKKTQGFYTKVVLFAISVVVLTWIASYVAAVAILSMIFLHEMSHLMAAKILKARTKGMYFLPGIGAVALIDDLGEIPYEHEFSIAIAGPIVGGLYAALFLIIGKLTSIDLFYSIGGLLCLINFVNLLPIYPLDGGRIAKSIWSSIHPHIGTVVLCLGLGLGAFLAIRYRAFIFALVTFFGYIEIREIWKKRISPQRMKWGRIAISFFYIGCLIYYLMLGIGIGMNDKLDPQWHALMGSSMPTEESDK